MKRTKPMQNKAKGPKGKDLTTFVRFGGLNLKTQKGYTNKQDKKTFHSPPAPKGFYAFPKIAQEFFLIGSMDIFQPHTIPKQPKYTMHKEVNGKLSKEDMEMWEKERDAFDWDLYQKRKDNAISFMRKEFIKTEGQIWSHLSEHIKISDVIDRNGSWVKTSMKVWQKAFNKMSLKLRMSGMLNGSDINKVYGIMGHYSMDHCEVFFDEKV